MNKPKGIQHILLPITLLSWLMGSGVIEYPLGRPQFMISFLYSSFMLTAYGVLLYYSKIFDSYTLLKRINNTGDFIMKIMSFGNGFQSVTAIVLAWNQRKGLKKCIQNIEMVDELLQKMGIPKDYDKTAKKEIGWMFAMFIIMQIVVLINAFAFFVKDTPIYIRAVVVLSDNYPNILVFTSDVMFITIVGCMRRKFARLNALLKSMSSTSPLSPQYMKLLYQRTGLLKPTATGFSKKTNDDTLLMKAAKQVHLDLVKISRSVNETFGLQILLSMAVSSVIITGLLYCSYTILHQTMSNMYKFQGLACSSCFLFFYVMKILLVNHICDRTSAEALRTGNIICELHEPMTNKEFRSEIREFVLQLIQNPLKFTAYDFVSLDYTFIQGVVGSITTYLVILIQLGRDISESTANSNSTTTKNTSGK